MDMDMEGCGHCLQSPQGIIRQYESIKTKAAEYVRDNRVSAAIYREGFEFRFAELAVALANQYPVVEVLSFNLPASTA